MLNLILLCLSGASSSFMLNKISKAAKEKMLEIDINAVSTIELADYIDDLDLVLLAPQFEYLHEEII